MQVTVDASPLPVYWRNMVSSPCLFGLFRPSVYLTHEVQRNSQLQGYVLAHELAHHRTGDHIWSVLRSICLVLHWYNPLSVCSIDLTTGKLLGNDALMRILGISQQDYLSRAKSEAKEIHQEQYSKAVDDPEEDTFYQQQLANTLADETLINCALYLNENGELVAVLHLYPMAGAAYYNHLAVIFQASELTVSP